MLPRRLPRNQTNSPGKLLARVNALRRIAMNRIGSCPASRHTDVDEPAILMPDRVDPSTESRDWELG